MASSWLTSLISVRSGRRTPVISGTEGHAELYVATLLAETREEIDRADRKASTLFAAAGVAVGALLAGLIAGRWSPFTLAISIQWLWWIGATAAIAGISALACAVYPRTSRRGLDKPTVVSYFGDVVQFKTVAELAPALRRSTGASLERLADQVHQVSVIVDRKYRLVRRGMWLLAFAATACTLSVVINLAVR